MRDDETQEFSPFDDEEEEEEGAGEHEVPPPATWAGRRRAAGEGDEAEPEPEDPGLSDEFDRMERGLDGEAEPESEEIEPEEFEELEPEQEPGDDALVEEELEPQAEAEQPEPEEEPEAEEEPETEEEPEPEEEPKPDDEDEEVDATEEEAGAEDADGPDAETGDGGSAAAAPPVKVADRVQAENAALAGIRARTAQYGKQPQPDADADEDGKPPRAKPLWARFLAGSLLIVISMAAATSISLLVFLTDLADSFGGLRGVQRNLVNVEGGDPQTILILGSDVRPGEEPAPGAESAGRSDTTMLLHVNPDRGAMTLLSIPRDLKVNIPSPGHGVDKFNAAYTYGGPKLTLEVVKRLTGLDINHVINIDFTGFADAVNAIGCVYVDVDRHYFNDNSTALSVAEQYAEIDIEAGYQRLCGYNALQYVRYRHEDTDLVRAARQQDFLREARQKIEPGKLVLDAGYRNDLVDVFAKYTTSDEALNDPIEVLELMKTFVAARKAPVREVHFPAQLGGPNDPYVTASEDAIENAVDQFLGTEGTPGPAPTGDADSGDGGDKDKPKPNRKPKPEPEEASGIADAGAAALEYAKKLKRTKRKDGDPMLEFPVYYPTRLLGVSSLNDASRAFVIDGPSDEVYHGFKFVAGFPGAGGFTEYYGVSGTDWLDAPILENPSETRTIDGREYMLFYDGDRLRLVAFKTRRAAYWVINTLTQTLDEDQMISIATSLRELGD